MLTNNAFNALLKTLEEPPAHAIFIFATTEPHKLPPTVISRCQRYDFRRINIESIVGQLKSISVSEKIDAEDAALFAIAKKGDGSMRDAESIFDQVVAFCGSELTYKAVKEVLHVVDQELYFRLTDLILANNTKEGFAFSEEVIMNGYDIQDFLAGFEEHLRNILVVRVTGQTELIGAPDDIRSRYAVLAEQYAEGDILRLLKFTADTLQSVKFSVQPRLKFEVAVINMIKMDSTVEISALLASLDAPSSSGGTHANTQRKSAEPARGSEPYRYSSQTGSVAAPGQNTTVSHPAGARSAVRPEELYASGKNVTLGALASLDSETAISGGPHGKNPVEAPKPVVPVHPYVKMLMEGLDAVLLPNRT
jgi:DNA polymerase III gamma/tau subunit